MRFGPHVRCRRIRKTQRFRNIVQGTASRISTIGGPTRLGSVSTRFTENKRLSPLPRLKRFNLPASNRSSLTLMRSGTYYSTRQFSLAASRTNTWPSSDFETGMKGLIRASLGNPYAVIVSMLTILVIGVLCLMVIPIDILPIFKVARGPGPHVLRGHAGHGRGKGHHEPPGALDRAGRQHEPAGIPLDRRRQRRAELLSNIGRPQRRAGPGHVAGDRNASHSAAGNASARCAAVRSHLDRPGVHYCARQQDAIRVDPLRRGPL